MNDSRQQALGRWTLDLVFGTGTDSASSEFSMVSGDASFRRYFRLRTASASYIAVDAPPEHEDNGRFVEIARLLRTAGIMVPQVFATDLEQGFMLLEDLGDELYLGILLEAQAGGDPGKADGLYRQAITSLVKMQQHVDKARLAPYDRKALHAEMALFDEWFCGGLLKLDLDSHARQVIADSYHFLEEAALAQTAVAVHRDYHSRNLLRLDPARFDTDSGPGIVDFQDAVSGAYTYDLVSLLRDCYIRWPQQQVETWALAYLEQAREAAVVGDVSPAAFLRDFDLMGLQRHIKVMGIFSRLSLRDKKSAYLADIPLVIRYFREVAARHPEMAPLLDWFDHTVMPAAASTLQLESQGNSQ